MKKFFKKLGLSMLITVVMFVMTGALLLMGYGIFALITLISGFDPSIVALLSLFVIGTAGIFVFGTID